MSGPLFESTDGRLFRLTLQGTLAPASERDVAAHAAQKAAAVSSLKVDVRLATAEANILAGPRLTARDFLLEGE